MKNNQRVELKTGKLHLSAPNITVWLSDNFSKDWYKDALHEAETCGKMDPDRHDSIRREILFSTCFLESYIFEWTRDLIEIEDLEDFFPATSTHRRNLKEKWRDIPQKLHKAGKIQKSPALDLSRLGTMLKYRNGLVHATSSRPVSISETSGKRGFPTKEDLRKLSPGWAIRIAYDLVDKLHEELGTSKPDYLIQP